MGAPEAGEHRHENHQAQQAERHGLGGSSAGAEEAGKAEGCGAVGVGCSLGLVMTGVFSCPFHPIL